MSSTQPFDKVFVVGGGAWGTALAALLAGNGIKTTLWAREREVVNAVNKENSNTLYLPGVALPESLQATSRLRDAKASEAILFVVPAQFARPVFDRLREEMSGPTPVALCSKGVEQDTAMMMNEVLQEVWPAAQAAVLSGPSFARDVVKGLPTAVTLAAAKKDQGAKWAATLQAPHFRPYLSDDLIGAELGGAVKNVLAIAAGIVEGRGLGESARAALIARGFAEFQRLGMALGAKAQTMAGLSGLGDLILTAASPQSRNMSLGLEIGKGRTVKDILAERNTVSEGVATASAIMALAKRADVDMPICAAVEAIVTENAALDTVIKGLLSRPLKSETK